MPAPKGHARYGGRQKGTRNLKTQGLEELCSKHGIDPFEGLIELAKNTKKPELRFQALKELCSYLYPKRKAIEVSGEIENPYMKMGIEELKGKVIDALERDGYRIIGSNKAQLLASPVG